MDGIKLEVDVTPGARKGEWDFAITLPVWLVRVLGLEDEAYKWVSSSVDFSNNGWDSGTLKFTVKEGGE